MHSLRLGHKLVYKLLTAFWPFSSLCSISTLLTILCSLSDLTSLQLHDCDWLTPVDELQLTNLRRLELYATELSPEWLEALLSWQPNLTELEVSICDFDEGSAGLNFSCIVRYGFCLDQHAVASKWQNFI